MKGIHKRHDAKVLSGIYWPGTDAHTLKVGHQGLCSMEAREQGVERHDLLFTWHTFFSLLISQNRN